MLNNTGNGRESKNSLLQCHLLRGWISTVCSPLIEALAGSTMLLLIFVIISICFYFLLVIITEHEGKNNYIIADCILIISMAFGFLVQLICVCRRSNPIFVQFGKLGHEHSTTYLMAGIYVFGVGTLFTILLRLVVYYHIQEVIAHCQLKNISKMHVADILHSGIKNEVSNTSTHARSLVLFGGFCYTDVAFDVVRLLFTLLQLYFIQTFLEATFARSIFVQFALYHTAMTNCCIWIRYVVKETHLLHHDSFRASIDQFAVKAIKMEEMMTPFILEYSLLAAGLLYTISSQMRKVESSVGIHNSTPHGVSFSISSINTSSVCTIEEYLPTAGLQEGDYAYTPLETESNNYQDLQAAPTQTETNSHQNNRVVTSHQEHREASIQPEVNSHQELQAAPALSEANHHQGYQIVNRHQEYQAASVQPAVSRHHKHQAATSHSEVNRLQEHQINNRHQEDQVAPVQPVVNRHQEHQRALLHSEMNRNHEHQVVNRRQEHQAAPGNQPGLIFGTVCGLLLIASSLMFNNKQNKFNRRSHHFFLAHEGILALLQVVAIFWILKKLQCHKRSVHKYHPEDTLLVIGYIGTIAFHGFAMYSVFSVLLKNNSESESTAILSIVHLLILVISQSLQTILVVISRRYSLTQDQKLSARTIRQLALFMLATNLGFWFLDSFVEMRDNASSSYPSGKNALRDAWSVVTSITYPFVVFYRFHSAEMLYEFWSRFRGKKIQ